MADIKDPIVLYFIVRESLNMNAEQICTQVAHAVQNLMFKYIKMQVLIARKDLGVMMSGEDSNHVRTTNDWIEHGSNKAILMAGEDDWNAIKTEQGKNCIIVKTAGKNNEPIETVLSFWPQHVSLKSDLLKRLHPLR